MKVLDGKIIDGKIKIGKLGAISNEDFKAVVERLKGYLLYVEGVEKSSYDNSDDDRGGCSSSRWPFGYYCEIDPENNSEHLLRIDGEIKGVVFYVSKGYNEFDYYPFLFDGSIQHGFSTGYSASHSSNYIDIDKVSLVKRGEKGAPEEGKRLNFRRGRQDTSF